MQPRPPSSNGRSSSSNQHVSSSRARGVLRKSVELFEIPVASQEVLSDASIVRPTSSFSKYRLLPAIGSPSPTNLDDELDSMKQVYPNKPKTPKEQKAIDIHIPHPPSKKQPSLSSEEDRQSLTPEDQRLSSSSQRNVTLALEGVEKLDLSKLDKPPRSSRRRKSLSNNSPSHAKLKNSTVKSESKNGELYDADDDDSDDSLSTARDKIVMPNKLGEKKAIIIPSPENYPTRDILLAVKLPVDGARHQRYFHSNETLQAIVDFAEDVAGQDFGGYILVSAAPRVPYRDLHVTIKDAGLQDKSVLHLEEVD